MGRKQRTERRRATLGSRRLTCFRQRLVGTCEGHIRGVHHAVQLLSASSTLPLRFCCPPLRTSLLPPRHTVGLTHLTSRSLLYTVPRDRHSNGRFRSVFAFFFSCSLSIFVVLVLRSCSAPARGFRTSRDHDRGFYGLSSCAARTRTVEENQLFSLFRLSSLSLVSLSCCYCSEPSYCSLELALPSRPLLEKMPSRCRCNASPRRFLLSLLHLVLSFRTTTPARESTLTPLGCTH